MDATSWGFVILFFGLPLVAISLLAFLFLPKFYLGRVRASPDQALSYIAHRLRMTMHRVEEKSGKLFVRFGTYAAVEFHARADSGGSKIYYRATATPSGWGTVFLLIILGTTGILAVILVLYLFARDRSFARLRMGSLIPENGVLEIREYDDIGGLVIRGLSESYRHASEACESEKTTYTDWLGTVIAVGIVIWFSLFGFLFATSSQGDFAIRALESAITALVFAVPMPAICSYLIRRSYRPRILEYGKWSNELHNALARETKPETSSGKAPSAFELLLEASNEMPVWIESERKAGLSRDPGAGFIVMLMTFGSIYFIFFAIGEAFYGSIISMLIFSAVGFGAFAVLFIFYRRWKAKRERDATVSLERWNMRQRELRDRMERYLQEL